MNGLSDDEVKALRAILLYQDQIVQTYKTKAAWQLIWKHAGGAVLALAGIVTGLASLGFAFKIGATWLIEQLLK